MNKVNNLLTFYMNKEYMPSLRFEILNFKSPYLKTREVNILKSKSTNFKEIFTNMFINIGVNDH
jgi:hypothetical protein